MMPSGQQISSTLDSKRQELDNILLEYRRKVRLHDLQTYDEVDRYVNISPDALRKMLSEECGEASILLSQLANYIQLETNRHVANINWLTKYLDYVLADGIKQADTYLPFSQKRIVAMKNNDVAQKIYKAINDIQPLVDQMQYIPTQLNHMADMYRNLQQTKRKGA